MKRQPDSHTDSRSGLSGCLRLFVLVVLLLTLIHAGLALAKEARPGARAAASAVTQSETPRNVEDYYLLLPFEYFDSIRSNSARRAAIKINDPKNGYLRATGNNSDTYLEVALFRKPDGSALIGVSEVTLGRGVKQTLYFLDYTHGQWHNRTAEVFRRVTAATIRRVYRVRKSEGDDDYSDEVIPHLYLMPRYDTTMRVVTAPGSTSREFTLAELLWQRGIFKAITPKPPPHFAGEWSSIEANISLELKLEQSKNEVTGSYNYVTLPKAARIREGRLAGFVRGHIAELLFENQEYENERGDVRLIYDGAKLTWETTDAPGSDSRLPVRFILKRKPHLPRSHRKQKPASITKG